MSHTETLSPGGLIMRALETALSSERNTAILDNLKLALSILRRRKFILPNEVTSLAPPNGFSFFYDEEQLRFLLETLPSKAKLERVAKSNWPLIPGPSRPMSLLEVRNHLPRCFHSMRGWFAEPKERFAHEEKVGPGWIALRTECQGQRKCLSTAEVPNAAEISWYTGIYILLRNIRLLHGAMAISASRTSSRAPVSVGHHAGTTGLHICCYPIGVAFNGIDFIRILKRPL